ncbi:phosphoribosylformylglycinamidine synthase [Thermonema lapsum]|uniref:Phosphoribosylformylglycinamidine synthase subunit PurQ n=1 Tax=Thermonema lapsum TaxID=28195 RepID=A0A846MR89_9BACT|nr:phosphoribosylformylglycinamidine synthase subunit PurQ [Thermonema lapsum]NIK73870.1 phosphoribosylformylglycinamidine synthase [Thermonema lapsum]
MKFGVVVFPGSNCDEDMIYTLRHVMGQEVVKLWHKDTDLQGVDFVVLPGGFSYGDYLRAGAIARFSPIMQEVMRHAKKGGYVMGICNGFQILTESGLLEGALLRNLNQRYICKNVYIKPATPNTILTAGLSQKKAYKIPIAHGEGRYYAPKDILKSIQDNDQILFQYCDASGKVTEEANPNGSLLNIAGICNKERNVFGMMPHPERAADELLKNTDGRAFFESILAHVAV